MRAAGLEGRAAVDDRHGLARPWHWQMVRSSPTKKLPSLMWRSGGGGVKAGAGASSSRGCLQRSEFRQAADRCLELLGQVAVAE